jgi:hypothetical protein
LESSFDTAAEVEAELVHEVLSGRIEIAAAAEAAVPKNLRLDNCPIVLT